MLRCILLSPKHYQVKKAYLKKCFSLWESVWQESFKNDFVGTEHIQLYADELMRQDYWICLFDEITPIAIACLRSIDLNHPLVHRDSWLNKYYQANELETFKKKNLHRGFICSNMTVSPEHRRSTGKNTIDLLVQTCFLHAKNIGFDFMLGITNISRSMDKTISKAGLKIITRSKQIYGVEMSTCYNTPQIIEENLKNYDPMSLELFNTTLWLCPKPKLISSTQGEKNEKSL